MNDVDFSFCIITDNSIEACARISTIVKTIRNLNIPNYEILIIGGEGSKFSGNMEDIQKYDFNEEEKSRWITKKKNDIVKHCKYQNVVLMHDYFAFHPSWYRNYKKFFNIHDYDVCCNPILMRNGMREFTDWVTLDHPERGMHVSLPYNDWGCTKWQYISGGYFIVKKDFFLENPLNEDLVAGQGEDVEWSQRIREHAKIICNPSSYVMHIKEHRNEKIHIWSRLL